VAIGTEVPAEGVFCDVNYSASNNNNKKASSLPEYEGENKLLLRLAWIGGSLKRNNRSKD